MKAENLVKMCETSMLNHMIPKFKVISSIDELNIKDFDKNKVYAVRSSCDIEDSKSESFAGHFDTFLNTSISELEERVKQVFEGFKQYTGKVIIQEMVKSDISGVIFSANPVGILNEMVIVAGYGLGDKIVEDKIDTTTYYYNKDDKLYYSVGEDILSDKQIKNLLNMALIIRDVLQYEVDIEYAIENDNIYILQARPITTLQDTDNKIVLDNSNIVESYPGISLPLTQDFVTDIYHKVFKSLVLRLTANKRLVSNLNRHLRGMTAITNGRIYYRISNWYDVLNLLPFSKKIVKIWQEMMGVQNKEVVYTVHVNKITKFKVLMSFINLILTSNSKMKKLNKYFTDNISKYRYNVEDCKSTSELLKTYENIMSELTSVWDITLVNDMYTFIFTYLAGKKNKDKLADIKNLESMKPVIELNELVKIYKEQGINKYFENKEKDYISKYGDRCPEELKLETKTYRTNPELLRHYIENTEVIEFNNNAEHNKKDKLFVKLAKKGIYNREVSRMNRTQIFGIAREIMLKIGENFVNKGFINNKEDIFYLYYNELREEKDYKHLIEERKQIYKEYENIPCFTRLEFMNNIINKHVKVSNVNILNKSNKLYGVASSVGKITGRVILVNKPDINIDTSNKIIVTKTTDPGWVFLIKNSLGIIAEKGSMLSHTAIITRELHKPSVVNVEDATKILKDNDIVELDAFNGVIKILERNKNE